MKTVPNSRPVAMRFDLLRSAGGAPGGAELGATVAERPPGRLEIRHGDAVVSVAGQVTSLNSPAAVAYADDKPRIGVPILRTPLEEAAP